MSHPGHHRESSSMIHSHIQAAYLAAAPLTTTSPRIAFVPQSECIGLGRPRLRQTTCWRYGAKTNCAAELSYQKKGDIVERWRTKCGPWRPATISWGGDLAKSGAILDLRKAKETRQLPPLPAKRIDASDPLFRRPATSALPKASRVRGAINCSSTECPHAQADVPGRR
jgi:hypothetical protein